MKVKFIIISFIFNCSAVSVIQSQSLPPSVRKDFCNMIKYNEVNGTDVFKSIMFTVSSNTFHDKDIWYKLSAIKDIDLHQDLQEGWFKYYLHLVGRDELYMDLHSLGMNSSNAKILSRYIINKFYKEGPIIKVEYAIDTNVIDKHQLLQNMSYLNEIFINDSTIEYEETNLGNQVKYRMILLNQFLYNVYSPPADYYSTNNKGSNNEILIVILARYAVSISRKYILSDTGKIYPTYWGMLFHKNEVGWKSRFSQSIDVNQSIKRFPLYRTTINLLKYDYDFDKYWLVFRNKEDFSDKINQDFIDPNSFEINSTNDIVGGVYINPDFKTITSTSDSTISDFK